MNVEPFLRPMLDADSDAVVEVHLAAFPSFFLTFLGPRFLKELYRGILGDPSGIAFVVEADGSCRGFVAGTADPSGLYGRLLQRRLLGFAWAAVIPVIRRPSIAGRLLRAFAKSKEASESGTGRAELMSLAVLPESQHQGLGARLVGQFVAEARHRGARSVSLTTDAEHNESVRHFYETLGFRETRRFTTREGRAMLEYERAL